MELCLMIEGQEGVSWDQWTGLAAACEEHGLAGLFRSDHYVSFDGEGTAGSLDAWAVLAALAARTERIRLGTLVSPATFRHPAVLAMNAVTVDHVSGGRVDVGMGAGWFEREHAAFGFPFPDRATRMAKLAEQLEIVHRAFSEDRFSFEGRHYRVDDLAALPKPVQHPHPRIVMGGSAGPVSARLAARWADEYNVNYVGPDECRRRRERLARAWEAEGRDPETLRFSLMTRCIVGADRRDLERRARYQMDGSDGDDVATFLAGGADAWVAGTVEQAADRLRAFQDAGVQRVMLQHLDHADLDTVALIGAELLPAVA
jgi:F420-dependent oxidoreductase-like protein